MKCRLLEMPSHRYMALIFILFVYKVGVAVNFCEKLSNNFNKSQMQNLKEEQMNAWCNY